VHDVKALLYPIPGDYIAQCISFGVTHVKIARWIREHIQHVLGRSVVPWLARVKWF
jgi:hypothetical protein